jgi:ABC-2 type transport system ATP-binding protein
VPAGQADELLELTGLATVAHHRLRSFSPGMSRRLSLATALLGDPRSLLLDDPTQGLPPKSVEWFHTFLRDFAASGRTVLVTARDPQEAAALADRVITLDAGRVVADQPVGEFARTGLRSEVSVRGPEVSRLADLLLLQGAEVRRESGIEISVSGLGRTEIGEIAHRNGILLHGLADRAGEKSALPLPEPAPGPASARTGMVSHTVGPPADPGPLPTPLPLADPSADGSLSEAVEEIVVPLSPGAAVTATVADPFRTGRRLTPVSGPLFRDGPLFHGDLVAARRRVPLMEPAPAAAPEPSSRPAGSPEPEPHAGDTMPVTLPAAPSCALPVVSPEPGDMRPSAIETLLEPQAGEAQAPARTETSSPVGSDPGSE